jgi:hypothetical protein
MIVGNGKSARVSKGTSALAPKYHVRPVKEGIEREWA